MADKCKVNKSKPQNKNDSQPSFDKEYLSLKKTNKDISKPNKKDTRG